MSLDLALTPARVVALADDSLHEALVLEHGQGLLCGDVADLVFLAEGLEAGQPSGQAPGWICVRCRSASCR